MNARVGTVMLPVLAVGLVLGGCGGDDADPLSSDTSSPPGSTTVVASTTGSGNGAGTGCADVIDATATQAGDEWVISATISSADTGEEKYADVWEARDEDGTVIVERVLTHPHVDEQPFTRSAAPVAVPADIQTLAVVAHDSVSGWCGEPFTLHLAEEEGSVP